jgi:hypothetical protein
LKGCVPDFKLADYILKGDQDEIHDVPKFKKNRNLFNFDHVEVLLDKQAAKKNVMIGLERIVARSNDCEVCTVQLSGHGTQVNDEDNDESDRLDEAFCCSDTSLKGLEGLLVDDEISPILKEINPDCQFSMLVDACHSDDITKEISLGTPKRLIYEKQYGKYIHPILKDIKKNHVVISGCKSNETSADAIFWGVPHGVLIYFFYSILIETPKIKWSDLYKKLFDFTKVNGYLQNPQITGSEQLLDQLVFNGV